MAKDLKVYNPDEVTIAVGPVLITSGYADGEFIRIEQESDDTEDVAGSDGEVAVSRSNDRRATITIILMQTAAANTGLSALSALARNAPGMVGGIVPFMIRDRNSGVGIYSGTNCWVMKPPDVNFDRTAQAREWTIRVADLLRVDAGNNSVGG